MPSQTMPNTVPIAILGSGITGLSVGMELKKQGKDFIILEKNTFAGGVIQTQMQNGFTFERGPNSLISKPEIMELIHDLGLENKLKKATAESAKRSIIWDGKLHAIAPSPKSILQTKLLSWKGKMSILSDFFVQSKWTEGETVDSFFARHFGKEVSSRLVSAMINGIYAGDSKKLEMESIFPQIIELEKTHGSIIKGLRKQAKNVHTKREIFTLEGGLSTLVEAMADYLKEEIFYDCEILDCERNANGKKFKVDFKMHRGTQENVLQTDQLISTLPSYQLPNIFTSFNEKIFEQLGSITYNPMLLLHLAFNGDEIKGKEKGFGMLAPNDEEKEFIGVMWNSNTFPKVAPEGKRLSTFFIRPGKNLSFNRDDSAESQKDKIQFFLKNICLPKFAKWTGIQAQPQMIDYSYWHKAIPQKWVGHQRLLDELTKFEMKFPHIHITGNFRSGVSVGDCIENGRKIVCTLGA